MAVETVVDDLSGRFVAESVGRQAPDRPVRAAAVRPQMDQGALRHAILAPPPAAIVFRTQSTPDAVLQFAVMVRREQGSAATAPVRFTIEANGRPLYARTIDATRKRERRWFEERVPLGPVAGDVELTLRTEAVGGTATGTPAWAGIRIVRRHDVDRQPARPDAPSLLVLLVDTLRADTLGCYGARPTASPTLDGLARRGRVFDVAVAQSSWTLPATASILTGLNPRSHGVNTGARDPNAAGRSPVAGGRPHHPRRARTSERHHHRRDLGQSAGQRRDEPHAGIRDVRRAASATSAGPAGRALRPSTTTFLRMARARTMAYRFLALPPLHGRRTSPYAPTVRPSPPPDTPPEVRRGRTSTSSRATSTPAAALRSRQTQLAYLRALYDGRGIRDWDDAWHACCTELAGLRWRAAT